MAESERTTGTVGAAVTERNVRRRRTSAVISFGSAWEKELEAGPAVAANDGARAPRRKKLPRTFDRTPKPWLAPLLELPRHTPERMLELRKGVLSLSRADASRLLRVAHNTIWDWETGYRSAPFSAFLAMRLIADAHPGSSLPVPIAAPLPAPEDLRDLPEQGRFVNKRQRAAELQQRMLGFAKVYNAARLLRDAWHGPGLRRVEYARRMAAAVALELQRSADCEALLYAMADALYCSPLGVPWEAS